MSYRKLTKEESKQWKEFGEVENLWIVAPLFAYKTLHAVNLSVVFPNSIFQTEDDMYVSESDGYVVAINNDLGVEHISTFNTDEFDKALDLFNKSVLALEKTNNL